MHTLVLIIQTFTGAYNIEVGHYPDFDACKKAEIRNIEMIKLGGDVLKVEGDCRVLYPELRELGWLT